MKAVLDTNVVVSAAMTIHGACARIVDLLADDAFGICADDRILDEYETVLYRPELQIVPADAAEVLDLIRSAVQMIPPYPVSAKLPDPTDLPFLEVAAAAGATLVTGNTKHFPRKACEGVTVLTPRQFLDALRPPR